MPNDIRICFIGDSFVNGTGDESFLGWPGRVSAHLQARNPGITAYNLGIRRDTSRDILARWRTEAGRRLPDSCAGRLVFSFGINDCILEAGNRRVALEDSLGNARHILGAGAAWRPTLMVGLPPVALAADPLLRPRIHELSDALAGLCAAHGIPYLELFEPLDQDPAWQQELAAGDGVHPGDAGYARLAGIILTWPYWSRWLVDGAPCQVV